MTESTPDFNDLAGILDCVRAEFGADCGMVVTRGHVVGRRADDPRHAAADGLRDHAHDALAFVVVEVGDLARHDRREEPIDAGRDRSAHRDCRIRS